MSDIFGIDTGLAVAAVVRGPAGPRTGAYIEQLTAICEWMPPEWHIERVYDSRPGPRCADSHGNLSDLLAEAADPVARRFDVVTCTEAGLIATESSQILAFELALAEYAVPLYTADVPGTPQYPPVTVHLPRGGAPLRGETARRIMKAVLTIMAEERAEARARRGPDRRKSRQQQKKPQCTPNSTT